jgi:8-oxo-dGTP diphosphatase
MARDRDEQAFLERYRPGDFPRPSVTVDLVVLTIVDVELRVLLVRRKEHPFRGRWALPGGFVRVGDGHRDQGEDLDAAAARELAEETGLPSGRVFLEQLRAFGRAGRDPRMRVITVAYYALVPPDLVPLVRAGGDASHVAWHAAASLGQLALAFDHDEIVAAALAQVERRSDESDILAQLVPPTFTIPELRAVRQLVSGALQDPGNFRRRFLRHVEEGRIERAPGRRITTSKPAVVYRFTAPQR